MFRQSHTSFGDRVRVGWVAAAVIAATFAGCRPDNQSPPPPDDANYMRGVLRYYAMATVKLGRPPTKMEQLEATLQGAVDDPSTYLRSTRDGQPYGVVWGLNLGRLPEDTIVVYERQGKDGNRMVMQVNGEERMVTEEEFAQIEFPKNHKPGVD